MNGKRDVLVNELKKHPDIVDVTRTESPIVSPLNIGYSIQGPNINMKFNTIGVEENFLSFLGLKITEGRAFNASDYLGNKQILIFNETARKAFDIKTDQLIAREKVIGFMEDYHFRPLQYELSPLALFPTDYVRYFYVKIASPIRSMPWNTSEKPIGN